MTEEPYVGMGATVGAGSDCYPATVVEIYHRGSDGRVSRIGVQMDSWTTTGGEFPYYEYEYERNPNGDIRYYTLRKNGMFKSKGWPLRSPGGTIGLGHRRYYYDPHY